MRSRFSLTMAILTFIIVMGVTTYPALAAKVKDGVIHWTAQSSWIRGPGHQEASDYFTETLNNICKGQLVIDKMYAAGELIGAFEAIPACSKGKLDLVHSTGLYLTGTLPYASLFIGAAANYMDYMAPWYAWQWQGGGKEMYQEYIQQKYNVMVLQSQGVPSECLYSFKPITKKEDFKGLKIRTTGLGMDFYKALGAVPMTMPMGEVLPALERKVLDAAEFGLPFTDYPVKIHEICPYALTGLLHQPPANLMEMYINLDSWKALPDELKQKVEYAIKLLEFWYIYHEGTRNADYWKKMIDEGLNVTKASPELQKWMSKKADELAEKYAAKDPWAKKVLDSQKAFLEKWNLYYDNNRWFR